MTLAFPRHAPPLVVLVGLGRTGKDTIGRYLKQRHGFAKYAFADPLYDAARSLFGVTHGEILALDKEIIIQRLGRSLRELVQRLGDHARSELGRDILIRLLVDRAIAGGDWKNSPLVVTDARMELEIDWARAQGAMVCWVKRSNAPPVRPHATESIAALHLRCFQPGDATFINDGTEEELFEQVDAWMMISLTLEFLGALEA